MPKTPKDALFEALLLADRRQRITELLAEVDRLIDEKKQRYQADMKALKAMRADLLKLTARRRGRPPRFKPKSTKTPTHTPEDRAFLVEWVDDMKPLLADDGKRASDAEALREIIPFLIGDDGNASPAKVKRALKKWQNQLSIGRGEVSREKAKK